MGLAIDVPRLARAALLAVSLFAAGPSVNPERAEATPVGPDSQAVPGQVIFSFADGSDPAVRRAAISASGPESSAPLPGVPGTRVLYLDEKLDPERAAARLEARDGIAWAEPNYIVHLKRRPNDTEYGMQWGLRNAGQNTQLVLGGDPVFGTPGFDISAERAWNTTTGGRVRVLVTDTGAAPDHPDLKANLNRKLSRNFTAAPGFDPVPVVDPADWADWFGHGTHTTGTIGAAGNNGLGVAGVNWKSDLVVARVCSATAGCTTADIAAGFAYAGAIGARVVNVSLGTVRGEPRPQVWHDVIAANPDTLYMVAAGNGDELGVGYDIDRYPEYPCSYNLKNILCVASLDPKGQKASSSNFGEKTVDLAAPGEYINSTWVNEMTPFEDEFNDGIEGWDQAPYPWKAGQLDDQDSLKFDGHDGPLPAPVSTASAKVAKSFSLEDPIGSESLRQCNVDFNLGLELHGSQTLTVTQAIDGGPERAAPPTIFNATSPKGPDGIIEGTASLAAAEGSDSVKVGFRYDANGSLTPLPRIEISRVSVACVAPNPPTGTYRAVSGTSMATPHVTGILALAAAAEPRIGAMALKRALLRSVKPTKSMKGITVTGGRADAARTVAAAKRHMAARLGRLRVKPRRARVPAGGLRTFRIALKNTGRSPARRLRVCPQRTRGLRVAGCSRVRSLAAGQTARVRVRVRATRRTGSYRLKLVARARGLAPRRAGVRLLVR